ncbi:hypothetical protein AJ80_00135 [Polytolypa hystricis UAMH7299]|uniref:Aminoglycoside phosphotransferase domain-containing protein n=1 Tax=Polytolypa hystricis (strain UAMH7299) TaxID=1447883 RepID=A0A2B7YVY1_POLH7|nr:hypothetical protein AJ80_00135 [Polytolypa hystricis UAMH7299]
MARSISEATSQKVDDEHLAGFEKVRAGMKLDNLPPLALRLRIEDLAQQPVHDCRILPDPLNSVTVFSGFLRSLLMDIPAPSMMPLPALFDQAMTMRLLKRETTIPVPKTYHFDASCDNQLSCPFILMEYIAGRPLYDVWFDQTITPDLLAIRHSRILQDVAEAVTQLNKYEYSPGGAVLFDKDEKPSNIGPFRKVNMNAMLARSRDDGYDGYDGSTIFSSVGPFIDNESFMTRLLDNREPLSDNYSQGLYKLLKLFIDLALSHDNGKSHEAGFVLTHPDLDLQNVIVSEEGGLLSLIDWDGVIAVPRCLGNERYPSWLTRDWDPVKYRYDEDAFPGPGCPNNRENSPTELEFYRRKYQEIVKQISSPDHARRTANSLVLENLHIAADDPVCTDSIIEKIFDEVKAKTVSAESAQASYTGASTSTDGQSKIGEGENHGGEDEDDDDDDDSVDFFFPYEVATGLISGEIEGSDLQWLKDGFLALLS